MEHTAPWGCTSAKEDKSKCRPGIAPKTDQEYFEILSLCVLQAGLSWKMIREKWTKFRHGFYGFDINKLAEMKANDLMRDSDVARDRKKVQAIIHNARGFRKITKRHKSFSNFLNSRKETNDEEVSKMLVENFKHLGEPSAEYFLHSVGYGK